MPKKQFVDLSSENSWTSDTKALEEVVSGISFMMSSTDIAAVEKEICCFQFCKVETHKHGEVTMHCQNISSKFDVSTTMIAISLYGVTRQTICLQPTTDLYGVTRQTICLQPTTDLYGVTRQTICLQPTTDLYGVTRQTIC